MKIPNLIIPGAGKSGTSSLHEYLNLHPKIEMSRKKEPHYFTVNDRYKLGFDFYDDLYIKSRVEYYGESSTAYFCDEVAVKRIRRDLQHLKIIILLKNPVERSVSHYLWQVSLLQEFRTFRKAVKYNINNPVNYRKPGWGGHFKSYYYASLYGRNVEKFINNFGKENIHIITTKELAEDTKNCLNGCFEFLKLPNYNISQKVRSNKTKKILNAGTLIKKFIAKTVKRGVVDFRLLYRAINRSIGKVREEDKIWLQGLLEDDLSILRKYYPDIEKRW
jgi:CRISPR/Cas system CSM-associated protein Csm2 small subunit